MATQRAISTISYNTEAFLVSQCNKLVENHIIQFYMYIFHIGEEGDKDHFHVYMQPNKRIDMMDIADVFVEPVPYHSKPLRCRPFRPSIEEHWILYVLHDPEYLAFHDLDGNQDGKIPYQDEDMKYSEDFDIDVAIRRARATLRSNARSISQKLDQGTPPSVLVETGALPATVATIAHLKHLDNNAYLLGRITNYEMLVSDLMNILSQTYQCSFTFGEFDINQRFPLSCLTEWGEEIKFVKLNNIVE